MGGLLQWEGFVFWVLSGDIRTPLQILADEPKTRMRDSPTSEWVSFGIHRMWNLDLHVREEGVA